MGCFAASAVFSGHCFFWLLVVPKDAASHRFTSFAEIENLSPKNCIASKDELFFRDGIRKLSERWEKVGSDGQLYFNWSVHSFCFINKCIFEHKKTDRTNMYSQYIYIYLQIIIHECTKRIFLFSFLSFFFCTFLLLDSFFSDFLFSFLFTQLYSIYTNLIQCYQQNCIVYFKITFIFLLLHVSFSCK